MHPLLSQRRRFGAYLLGWVPFAALQTIQQIYFHWSVRAALLHGFIASVLAAGLFLTSGYLCNALDLKKSKPWIVGSSISLASLLMGVLWAELFFLVMKALGNAIAMPDLQRFQHLPLGIHIANCGMGALFYLLTVGLNYILIAHDQAQEAERTEQDLRMLARDAELKALRAQLNPHFLFNSLNSISALTTIDPKRARQMCVLLSDFLRKSLRLGERPMVKLAEELELVKAYLSIEQIRFGSRLEVDWDIAPEAEEAIIPTLLLQPLVENAIKHGIAAIPEGGCIRIAAARKGGFIEIRVENPSDPDAEHPQGLGMGLRQVKSRLQGRYGGEIFFDAVMKNNRYTVLLAFPSEVNP
jgi:two-component system, LytTR family, sensor histidine kinase AlgZ